MSGNSETISIDAAMYNPKPFKDSSLRYPLQCIFLKLNASWPVASTHRTVNACYVAWSWYVIASVTITCGFQAAFLVRTFGDIMKTTENMCTTLMGILNLMRLIHMRLNQRKFRKLLEHFADHIWIEKNSQPEVERKCERKMKTFRLMAIATAGLIAMYVTMPLIEYYGVSESERYEKPFPYKMLFPYNAQRTVSYIFTYLFTSLAGICVVTTLFAEDSFFGFFVVYACGQFELLHARIQSLVPAAHRQVAQRVGIEQPQAVHYFQLECRKQLKRIVHKHRHIIEFAHTLEEFFSGVLLLNFMISSVLICMVGFQLMTSKGMFIGDLLKLVLYITSSFSQLGVLCWQGDALIELSKATADFLYGCQWEGARFVDRPSAGVLAKAKGRFKRALKREQQTPETRMASRQRADDWPLGNVFSANVQFMILCSQKPLRITAFKFSTLSLQSFSAIISTSMSYFTLLQSVYSKMDVENKAM